MPVESKLTSPLDALPVDQINTNPEKEWFKHGEDIIQHQTFARKAPERVFVYCGRSGELDSNRLK
jgi:hypothetical protein